jgi:predicted membrane protein
MNDRGQLSLGIFLVVLGLIFLLGTVFDINLWPYCWSVGFIALGVWLVMRPRLAGPGVSTEVSLIGDLRRRGNWAVRNEEIWHGIGDMELDLTQAAVPEGESVIRIYSFVGDLKVYIPSTVGVKVRTTGFFVDADMLDEKIQTFLSPAEVTSPNYAMSDRRVRIDMTGFVAEVKARQA